MHIDVQARRALERDLRNALANDEFVIHYQPLVNLQTERICGFEALIRWNHPQRGTISPLEFIPFAEESALIVPIGEWVLRAACMEAAKWPSEVRVAVNLSPVQFRTPNLYEVVTDALSHSGLAADRLELEITESALLSNQDSTVLRHLRALGVRIAMDDFGTGHSSLSYLRSFPFDKIKIDRSFVHDLSSKKDCRAIISAVSQLAISLGIETTAEGVETQEELDYLKRSGCTEGQGHFFSKARPAKDVLRHDRRGREAVQGRCLICAPQPTPALLDHPGEFAMLACQLAPRDLLCDPERPDTILLNGMPPCVEHYAIRPFPAQNLRQEEGCRRFPQFRS